MRFFRIFFIVAALLGVAGNSVFAEDFQYVWEQEPPEKIWQSYLPMTELNTEQKIFRYVADEIRLDAYRGSLRGMAGTILAGSGNSIDKSLVLKRLLKEINQKETRLVHAVLTPGPAVQLTEQYITDLRKKREEIIKGLSYDQSGLQVIPREYVEEVLDQRQRQLALVEELARVVEDRLTHTLGDLNIDNPTNLQRLKEKIQTDLQDHAWVQVKRADGSWYDLDPTLKGFSPGERITDSFEVIDGDTLPPQWRHSVEFTVSAEFVQGGQYRSKTLLKFNTFAPLLAATSILLVHPAEGSWYFPDSGFANLLKKTMSQFGGAKSGGLPYRPEIRVGDQAFVGDFLKIKGWIIPDFFQPAPPVEFVREWVCFRLAGPGYKAECCRSILDRRIVAPQPGENAKALLPIEYTDKEVPQALAGFQIYTVLGGNLPDELVVSRIQKRMPSMLSDEAALSDPEAYALEAAEYQIPDETQLTAALGSIAQTAFVQNQKIRAVWRQGAFWGSITSPNIYSFRIVLAENSDGSNWSARWFDIIRDDYRIPENGALWKAAIARSAIESAILGFMSGIGEGGSQELFSTPMHFKTAKDRGDPILVIKDKADLEKVQIPKPWRDMLEKRLADQIIVTPSRPFNNLHSWIEINRKTKASGDAMAAVDQWPGPPGQQATLEYISENRGKMRMATEYAQRFCNLVQCATSTFKLAVSGVRVWGTASFEYAKDVYDAASGIVSDCKKVRLRLRVPKKYRGAKYEKYRNAKKEAFDKGANTPKSRKEYEKNRSKSPADLKGGESAGPDMDWDHTLELACGGAHDPKNIAKMPADLNRWFGATLGAMCSMLCEGTSITGLTLIFK